VGANAKGFVLIFCISSRSPANDLPLRSLVTGAGKGQGGKSHALVWEIAAPNKPNSALAKKADIICCPALSGMAGRCCSARAYSWARLCRWFNSRWGMRRQRRWLKKISASTQRSGCWRLGRESGGSPPASGRNRDLRQLAFRLHRATGDPAARYLGEGRSKRLPV